MGSAASTKSAKTEAILTPEALNQHLRATSAKELEQFIDGLEAEQQEKLAEIFAKRRRPEPRDTGLPWLEELFEGEGCSIPKTEERAITAQQLKAVLAYIKRHCEALGWVSTNPARRSLLTPATVNLYDLAQWLIKPATEKKKCAYVELVAAGKQVPKWFVSHWWGEPVHDFVICIVQHVSDRALSETTAYWVCAYANNQWQLAGDVSDNPAESSFRKAIDLADGTVTILDRGAVTFSRVWCTYEIYVSLQEEIEERSYMYDVYTMYTDNDAVGITQGLVEVDFWSGDKKAPSTKLLHRKAEREARFPQEVTQDALAVEVQKAQSSVDSDRIHILNAIVNSSDLDGKVPESHENFEKLNRLLRGRFGAGMYRRALTSGRYLDLVASALKESGLQSVFLGLDEVQPLDAARVAQDLPQGVKDLNLSLAETGLDSSACEALSRGLPWQELSVLKLVLDRNRIGDTGMTALSKYFSKTANLTKLDLRLGKVGVTSAGVEELCRPLGDLKRIRFLWLAVNDNQIGLGAVQALEHATVQMAALEKFLFNVDATKMDDSTFMAIISLLDKLGQITNLSLWARKNSLTSAVVEPLIKSLRKLTLSALTLQLDKNKLDEKSTEKLDSFLHEFGNSKWKITHAAK